MLGIDGPEFLVIMVILIIVIGPKELPKMMRSFGKAAARMRTTANEFRRQFDDAMKEAELDELKKTIGDVKNLDPRNSLSKVFDPIRDVASDVRASLDPVQDVLKVELDHSTPEQQPERPTNMADVETDAKTVSAAGLLQNGKDRKVSSVKTKKVAVSKAKPVKAKAGATVKKRTEKGK